MNKITEVKSSADINQCTLAVRLQASVLSLVIPRCFAFSKQNNIMNNNIVMAADRLGS